MVVNGNRFALGVHVALLVQRCLNNPCDQLVQKVAELSSGRPCNPGRPLCVRYIFGQVCVVDPLDGLGAGDGDAANTGDTTTKAARAPTATINARITLRNGLRLDVGGVSSALSAGD
jgi:hypothetical protein